MKSKRLITCVLKILNSMNFVKSFKINYIITIEQFRIKNN